MHALLWINLPHALQLSLIPSDSLINRLPMSAKVRGIRHTSRQHGHQTFPEHALERSTQLTSSGISSVPCKQHIYMYLHLCRTLCMAAADFAKARFIFAAHGVELDTKTEKNLICRRATGQWQSPFHVCDQVTAAEESKGKDDG